MKNILFSCLAIISISLLIFIASCSPVDTSRSDATDVENEYGTTIKSLEEKLDQLILSQSASNEAHQKEIERLQAIILELKQQETSSTETSEDIVFTYEVKNSNAIITGYNGIEEEIVIPSHIDGYRVIAISDNCFSSATVKSIIISEGIESIGWFAFSNCTSLQSVTVPDSIKKIGHSAFGDGGGRITIFCHQNSFALSYAQSYGITHTVI